VDSGQGTEVRSQKSEVRREKDSDTRRGLLEEDGGRPFQSGVVFAFGDGDEQFRFGQSHRDNSEVQKVVSHPDEIRFTVTTVNFMG